MTIEVKYIDHLGSDLDVVNAARVSFDKESEWEGGWSNDHNGDYWTRLSEQDTKLIGYLAKHNHWSPFSHCYLKFRIKAPIFVARQLQKHTVGLAWNEVSRRYVDSDPAFYFPVPRARADNVKQGSSNEFPADVESCEAIFMFMNDFSEKAYKKLLELNVCPEQARMVLPQSMLTEWIWSGSLMAFARVCQLRLDSHTQSETRDVAKGIAEECNRHFPVSWAALNLGA